MNKFIEWHKGCIKCVQDKTNWSNYQLLWLAFFKGLILGWVIL